MALDVSQCAESIELQLEETFRVIERLGDADEEHRGEAHVFSIADQQDYCESRRHSWRNFVGEKAIPENTILVYKGDRQPLNNQSFCRLRFS